MENNPRHSKNLSTSHKFARNAVFNIAAFIVSFPILILLTPYVLKVLGNARFGIWAIAGVITSYAQLSDIGMTTAIIKFVAEHFLKKDIERISDIVSTALLSYAVLGGAIVAVILIFRHGIVMNLLKVPLNMRSEALFVITWIAIIFYFNIVFSVYNSILHGIQRMDLTNIVKVVSRVLSSISIWIILATGFGLRGLIVNRAIFSSLAIGANVILVKKFGGGVKVNPFRFSFAELRRIIKYSINIFFANLLGFATDPMNKIILAAYASLPYVSFYEIGYRVKQLAGQIFGMGIMPLLPASSELDSANKKQEIERIFLSLSRIIYLFAVPSFILVIILAEPLVQVWLGDGYKLGARAIQFLLLGNLFSLMVMPHYIIFQGIGKPHLSTLVSGICGFVNISISIILVQLIGYYGVLVAILLSLLSSSILMVYLFHRKTSFSFLRFIKYLKAKPLQICCVAAGSLWLISRYIKSWGLLSIFLAAIIFLVLYMVLLLISGSFTKDEKKLFLKLKIAILGLRE